MPRSVPDPGYFVSCSTFNHSLIRLEGIRGDEVPKRRPIGLWFTAGAFAAAEYRDNSLFIACYQGFARRLTWGVG